ncbi:uncharacterized protein LOC105829627 [Monomorium pharaonis]|uniref:uncharacterized protein LOC105829627 n=1 Tax=Monomorium pharaonis TaxID=307658 RepID=UPI001745F97E|nr:uncharacterized protein LOC105829627 [Monomorium pharaonis]
MKGIYVLAVAFLACWAVSVANSDQPEQSISEDGSPQADILTECPFPEEFPENTTTNLPHEYDCTRFYKCFLGEGVEQLCPLMRKGDPVSRLHYNRRLQVCDWPWQAGCESCPGRNPDGSYPPTSRISGPNNCHYYECINGQPYLRQCPDYTCFSRTCQECVSNRDGGKCGPGRITTTSTTTTRSPPPPLGCLNSNGSTSPSGDTQAHDCDCAKYLTCHAPDWIADGQCQGGLHYSPSRKTCLPPNEANNYVCRRNDWSEAMKGIYVLAVAFLASLAVSVANSDQPKQSISEDGSPQIIPTVCPFPEQFPENTTTNLPHEWDCTRFYKCFLGEGVEQLCPLMRRGDPVSRLHYNRRLQVCDWPWQAGCESCPGRNPDGSYPPSSKISGPDNCRQYYECINGYPTLRECPSHTCFSRTCQECVSNRDGGNCGWGPTVPTRPTIPTRPTPPVGCRNSDGSTSPNGDTQAHDCDCAKYLTCRAPNWIADGQCQGGLHYSPSRKTCLPPNEANNYVCRRNNWSAMKGIYVLAVAFLASLAVSVANSDQPEQSISEDGSPQIIPTVCPFPERFPENTTTNLPHEWDCTRFYKCFLGEGVEQLCPLMRRGDPVSRLHYNRRLQVCDWPWQAGCESCPGRNPDGSYPPSSKISGPDNCRQYYECINGYPTLRECPSYTCFSRTCQECVSNRDGGKCGPPIRPRTCRNDDGSESPDGSKKAHRCDCSKYLTCQAPNWILDQCQGGLHFSPSRQICLPPNEANNNICGQIN